MDIVRIYFPLAASLPYIAAQTIYSLAEDNAVLPCHNSSPSYPSWHGPNNTGQQVIYNYPGKPEFEVPFLQDKASRLRWDESNNGSLVILNVTRSDSGTYICTFKYGMDITVELPVELIIRVLPKPAIQNNTEINGTRNILQGTEGQPLNLTCVISNGYPEPQLSWYTLGNETDPITSSKTVTSHSDGSFTVTQTFEIVPLRSDDRVTYVCESSFENPDPSSFSEETELYLNLLPSTLDVTSVPMIEGAHGNMTECVTSGFRPRDIKLEWRLDNVTYTSNNTVFTENLDTETYNISAMLSTNVYRENNGKQLECVVYHEALTNPLTASTTLLVKFKAEFSNLTGISSEIVANGINTISLECSSGSSNPKSNITWVVGDRDILSNNSLIETAGEYEGISTTQQLIIVAERELDNTEVYCIAHNGLDDTPIISNTRIIQLLYHPRVTMDGPTAAVEGQTDIQPFRCFSDSNPASTFTWYHDNQTLTDNIIDSGNISDMDSIIIGNMTDIDLVIRGNVTYISEYVISTVTREHAGNYTCVANNGYQPEDRSSVTLIVDYKAVIKDLYYFNDNGSTTIRCEVDSYPAAEVSIYKNGTLLVNGTQTPVLKYTIDPSDCLASGIYLCAAFNKYNGDEAATASINVTASCTPQRIEHVTPDMDGDVPHSLKVTLLAYPIPGSEDITWSMYEGGFWVDLDGGYVIPLTDNMFTCGLNLSDLNGPQFGYFRVEVHHSSLSAPLMQIFDVMSKVDAVKPEGKETTTSPEFLVTLFPREKERGKESCRTKDGDDFRKKNMKDGGFGRKKLKGGGSGRKNGKSDAVYEDIGEPAASDDFRKKNMKDGGFGRKKLKGGGSGRKNGKSDAVYEDIGEPAARKKNMKDGGFGRKKLKGNGSGRKNGKSDAVYEDIGEPAARTNSSNVYSDLNTSGSYKDLEKQNHKIKTTTNSKRSATFIPSSYVDMTMTLTSGGNKPGSSTGPMISEYASMRFRSSCVNFSEEDNISEYLNCEAFTVPVKTGCKDRDPVLYENLQLKVKVGGI